MSCLPVDPGCVARSVTGHAAGAVTGSVISGIAHAVEAGVAWTVSSTVDWWVRVPSPDLAAEPAVGALQRWLLPVTVAVAVGATLAAAARITLTRKANPLVDVGFGLLVVAATSALGVVVPVMLLKAGDAWSSWVLQESTGGQFGARLTAVLTMQSAASAVEILLGVVAMILTVIQAVLMLFRQAALLILAGVLPLAAAGTLAPATRGWFRRTTGWMLALIFYKPAAAAVYATAFTLLGRGSDPRTVLMGFAMVALSLLALPVLMKFFTWTTGTIDQSGGGGLLGTAVSGAIAFGAIRGSGGSGGSGGSSATDQARFLAAQLGPSAGGGADGPVSTSGVPGATGAAGPQGQAGWSGGPAAGGPPSGSASGAGMTPGASPAGAGLGSAGMAAAGGGAGSSGAAASAAAGGTAGAGSAAAGAGAAAAGAAGGPVGLAAAAVADGAIRSARGAAGSMLPDQPETPSSEG
jgi:hypothetical protein